MRYGFSRNAEAYGSLHESYVHKCLKSSLAFRKPVVAVASRRPVRADGPKVGLDGTASLGAGARASSVAAGALPLGRLGYLCAEGGKAKFVAAPDCSLPPVPP